jgi:hypothetical protein
MISGSTQNTAGGAVTNVTGGYSRPDDGLIDYVRDRLNTLRRVQPAPALAGPSLAARHMAAAPTGSKPAFSGSDATTQAERELALTKIAEARAERERLAAMSAPPPMTYTYPYGSAGFLTPDIDKMNAYQRQAYLPQGSSNNAAQDAYANKIGADQFGQEMAGIEDQWKRSGGYGPTV